VPGIRPGWFRIRNSVAPNAAAQRTLWVGGIVITCVSVGMLGLLGRVIQLQTHPPAPVLNQIDSQHGRRTLQSRRGNLLDRRGRVMATTHIAHRLFVDPQLIQDPNTFSEQIGYRLGYDPARVEQMIGLKSHRRYVVIDPRLNDERLAQLKAFRLRGLADQPYVVRDYPLGPVAGQVIGFVGVDHQGLEGLERTLNSRLRGQSGSLSYLRDASRKPLWVNRDNYDPPQDGQAIRLSLDVTLQTIAETELAQGCQAFGAPSGQLIVMDPYTGEILAMANYPAFDPNHFMQSRPDDHRNRCVTDVFEPGSTFKPFIWAATTEAGLARPNEIIDTTTTGVYVTAKGRRLRDVRGHGRVTWDDVLVMSSNIGMAIIGQRMEAQRLFTAVRAFGFGRKTGSGLPGEVSGIVNPLKQWNHYSVTSVPMGQEIAVTALQLTAAFCAIANDGYVISPTILVRQTDGPDSPARIYECVLSPKVAAHTREVLRRVVTEGTGRRANSALYTVFGKTGTAQIADHTHGGYLQDQYISSFIGGAPVDTPRLVVAAIIHRPDIALGHYGGTVAAPVVRRVIEQSLAYLGVVPDVPDEHNHTQLASFH